MEFGRGIRVPGHVLQERGESLSEEWVVRTLETLRTDLEGYLDQGEPLVAVYTGFGASFSGAGQGVYVFAATDRRFMLLDQAGRFAEVDYAAVTSIDRDAGVHEFEVGVSRKRELALSGGALLGLAVLTSATGEAVFSLGTLGALGATAYYGNRHFNQTKKYQVAYEDVIIRTPSSRKTSAVVEAEADHWLGTVDVDVQTEHSEQFVLRQWLRPSELSDEYTSSDMLNFAELRSFGTNGAVSEPGDFEAKLSKIVRNYR